ncbi:MAG: 4-hydroxy-3-methylbut-2-enyl diphosphate reductase, partial [Longicatena sp.]|nr:4-hydroxy-3-methylbut-2-enyl diphosphate reductase [Longicatena sp.]
VYTQELIQKQIENDFDVLYIGKKGHPEAEAVLAISSRVHLIENVNDIDQLPSFNNLFVSNQTTMSLFDIEALFKAIEIKYPHAIFAQEICQATTMRQKAIADINADEVELLYIVGDKASNNSNRLAQIAKEHGVKNVYLIDSVEDIEPEQLTNIQCCAVSSGASTPTYLTNQVIEYLENYPNMNRPCVNIQHIL